MANEKLLIEKEPIKKFIENGLNNPDPKKAFGHDAIEILAEIEFAPTVDAVEVVRCKDCRWRNNKGCPYMNYNAAARDDYDYCSDGERRTDND